jgi:hypothetical protein
MTLKEWLIEYAIFIVAVLILVVGATGILAAFYSGDWRWLVFAAPLLLLRGLE